MRAKAIKAGMVPVMARTNVRVEVFDAQSWQKLDEQWYKNLAVNSGLDMLRDFMFGDQPGHPTHGAVGTSGTAAAAGDTALGAEVFRDVIASRVKGAQTLTVQFVLGSTHANGETLVEAGLFNAAAGGTMYARVVISPVNKTALLSVLVTWTLSWSAA